MKNEHPPIHGASAFDCPHCGSYSLQTWAECTAYGDDEFEFQPKLKVTTCLACQKVAVWHHFRKEAKNLPGTPSVRAYQVIYPTAAKIGPNPNPDMPADVAEMYDEASRVAAISPRSATVLLRLALEALLEHLYPESKGNLNEMIKAANATGLPERVQKMMDLMRFGGNTSAHEIRSDDSIETAQTMFRLLNVVVERLITEPKEVDEMFEALPEGVRKGIENRDKPKDG